MGSFTPQNLSLPIEPLQQLVKEVVEEGIKGGLGSMSDYKWIAILIVVGIGVALVLIFQSLRLCILRR